MAGEMKPRSIEKEIIIDAPVEAVWKALTDAEEITNWFQPQAEVKPGKGGFIRAIWGEDQDWTSPIDEWKPNEHLRLVYVEATPPEMKDKTPFFIPFRVAVDYYLKSRGGQTVLRLVHSGLSPEASWDNQYDGTIRGWNFELGGLQYYLEHHRGKKRRIAHAKADITGIAVGDAWSRMFGPDGLLASGSIDGASPGDALNCQTTSGDHLHGEITIIKPPNDLAAILTNHGSSYLRVRIDEASFMQPQAEANLWLSAFGVDEKQVKSLQARWQKMLDDLFANSAAA